MKMPHETQRKIHLSSRQTEFVSKHTHYFGAGPAALPDEVKHQIQHDILHYQDAGVSILELSHRSEYFAELLEQSKHLLRTTYSLPDNYHILFMAGGATFQFDAVPLNLIGNSKHASYLDTGFWSRKSGSLASKYTDVRYVQGLTDEKETTCCLSPDQWQVDTQSAYLHVTPNETISGVEFVGVGDCEVPVVADMTSCLLMQDIDIKKFAVIYAATQKSLGIAGLSVVIIRDDLLTRVTDQTPDMLRYDLHVEHNSIVNTAPVFACYVMKLMLEWVDRQGGTQAMVQQAQQRASLLYEAIDNNPKLINNVCDHNRSSINVVFNACDEQVVKQLLAAAEAEGLIGLQGHRLAGGVRASMYNGAPIQAVKKLAQLIREA